MKPSLTVVGARLLPASDRRACLRAARRVFRAAQVPSVGLVFVHDLEMRALNRSWRKIDTATDVLSFAFHEGDHIEGADDVLGDLVISVDTARRQARILGHTLDEEIAVLVAHGICHLAGLDHERSEAEATIQRACEHTLLGCAKYDVALALSSRRLQRS